MGTYRGEGGTQRGDRAQTMTVPVSVVVITKDEERNIERCLRSVDWAADTVVVDAHSTDLTREKAMALGARVVERDWPGYGPQKNFGVSLTANAWVLNLDADEEVTSELAAEIGQVVRNQQYKAHRVLIPTYFMGRPLKHYGRAPRDPGHIRLFHKDFARFDSRLVHEVVDVDGPVGWLKAPILHYSYPTVGTYWRKIHYYADLEAHERADSWPSLGNRWVRFVGKLGWMLGIRRGIFDGPSAWLWIAGQAYQDWLATSQAARLRRTMDATRARA
jgi:glycosyltransferase involved in cell wall biosynthesis